MGIFEQVSKSLIFLKLAFVEKKNIEKNILIDP